LISLEILEEPDSLWNRRLQSSPHGTIYQTKEYGSYIQSRLKSKPLFLTFNSENGEIMAQLLAFQTFKGTKKINKLFGRGLVYSLAIKTSLLPKFIYWNFGPVILNSENPLEVLDKLGNYIIKQKVQFSGYFHPLNSEYEFPQRFNFKRKTAGTFIINLKQNIEQIFKNTDKQSVQKNIKRSQERGVQITEITSKENLIEYYNILNKFRKENNLQPYSYEDVVDGYDFVKPVGQKGFLAWFNKEAIGGIFISSFNGNINEWGIAGSKLDREKKLYSLDFLRWKIIEWGVEKNYNYYDLSGIKIENRTSKEEGIFRNKKKWGGELFKYPIYYK